MVKSNLHARSMHLKEKLNNDVRPGKTALIFGAVYILLSGIYIIVSTQYVAAHADFVDAVRFSELQKGLLFVWVTGILMSAFVWIIFTRIDEQQKKIIQQRDALLISERQAIAGILSSSVAHDINNILTTIGMAQHLIENKLPNDPESMTQLSYIRQGYRQLESLTERMIETGKSNIKSVVRNYNFAVILKEALEFSKSHDDVRFAQIVTDCPTFFEMVGFPDLIQQMLFNLFLNSCQARHQGCKIIIRVRSIGENASIEFHDNGPGIPEDQRELIFQPFFTTKKVGQGLGMLSIQACVEAHEGEIDIDTSEELGGAKFSILIPRQIEKVKQETIG